MGSTHGVACDIKLAGEYSSASSRSSTSEPWPLQVLSGVADSALRLQCREEYIAGVVADTTLRHCDASHVGVQKRVSRASCSLRRFSQLVHQPLAQLSLVAEFVLHLLAAFLRNRLLQSMPCPYRHFLSET